MITYRNTKRNMNKITRIILACLLLLTSVVLIYSQVKDEKKDLFYDNAKFAKFTDEKKQTFELKENKIVKFTFKSKIDSGELQVEVRDSKDNIIYNNQSNGFNDQFTKNLPAGKYYYYLKAYEAKGYFTFRAQID